MRSGPCLSTIWPTSAIPVYCYLNDHELTADPRIDYPQDLFDRSMKLWSACRPDTGERWTTSAARSRQQKLVDVREARSAHVDPRAAG